MMNMEQQGQFFPKGKATDVFDRDAARRFQTDLYNLALDKDVAKKRNLLYMVLLGLCVVAMVFVVTTASFKTYVVRVDNATGQVETGGELKATNYNPQEAEIRAFLVQFVRDTRTIPLDPVQYKTNWEHAQHFLTQEAAQKLNGILQSDNPAAKFGRVTTQPTIKSIQAQPGSPATYQVRWQEDEFALSGNATGVKTNYTALLSVMLDPPRKEEELLINPLGLKIKDLTITREMEEKK
ncbi:MAG: VirB8/TrbF family protein [Selenomonas noxia]